MRKNRIIALLLTFAMVMGCLLNTSFAYTNESRASDYLDSYAAGMNQLSGRTMEVYFRVYGTHTMDKIGVSKIVVWENDGDGWTEYGTYKESENSKFYTYSESEHFGTMTFTGLTGCQYKATITFYAKLGTGSDSRTVDSNTASCRS